MTLQPLEAQGDLYERICQLADNIDLLVRTLKLDPDALPAARLVALTRPVPTSRFRISEAAVSAVPRELLARSPLRVSFSILLTTAVIYQFADAQFAPDTVGSISGTALGAFGLDGHVGQLWGSASAAGTVTIIEQFADSPS